MEAFFAEAAANHSDVWYLWHRQEYAYVILKV